MLFRLGEYETAASRTAHEAVSALARVRSPLLAQIESQAAADIRDNVVSLESQQVRIPIITVRCALQLDIEAVCRRRGIELVLTEFDSLAEEQGRALVAGLVEGVAALSAATGNQVDARGPLTHDIVFHLLEKMEIPFNDDGEADLTFVGGSDAARQLAELPQMTPDEQTRFDEIMKEKREEFESRQRHRRLSRPAYPLDR